MRPRGFLRFLAREWPVAGAALALASLIWLPRYARPERRLAEGEAAEVEALRARAEAGEVEEVEEGAGAFLARRPDSPWAAEVRFLLGRAAVLRARRGDFPGLPALDRAWRALEEARLRGFERAAAFGMEREILGLLLERDLAREAVDRATELLENSKDPEVGLDLARALARRAAGEPALAGPFLDEASGLVSGYLAAAGPGKRLAGYLAHSEILWRLGRDRERLALLDRVLPEFPAAEDLGRLQLERGKVLYRMGAGGGPENMGAVSALEEAERLLESEDLRQQSVLLQAALYARQGNPLGQELGARLIRENSPLAPLARLVLGRFLLPSRPAEGLKSLRQGLAAVRRPRLFDENGFDFAEVYAGSRGAWEAPLAPEELLGCADFVAEALRLYPRSWRTMLDRARLLHRAGRHSAAADQYLAAVEGGGLSPAEAEDAVRRAADTCFAGALYRRAGGLYRRFYEMGKETNADGLFRQGESLRRARVYHAPAAEEPDALKAYQDFLAAAPRDPRAPRAILHRAALLAELGRGREAVEEYRRLVDDPDPVAGPDHDDWAEALLGLGRVLLGQPGEEGRRTLEEYLERYGTRRGSIEANVLLARAEMAASEWAKARGRLEAVQALAGLDPESEWVRHARFLRGDLLLAEGKYAEAARAYDEAYRACLAEDVRLWGLLGRARALARLDRKEEGRRDYLRGLRLFEENRERYESSFEGFGRDYWTSALARAGQDLR